MDNEMIFRNDVPALHQTNEKFKIVCGGPRAKRVLFLGNSITLHEKAPQIGWNGNWGMAASSEENDYVHQVVKALKEKWGDISFCVVNAAEWEWNYERSIDLPFYEGALAFHPDLLIVRLGENINKQMLGEKDVTEPFVRLVKLFAQNGCEIVMTSLFWAYGPIDEAIRNAAKQTRAHYVDIRSLGEKDENKALGKFEHPGVQGHPGDLGMQRIAEAILSAIRQ